MRIAYIVPHFEKYGGIKRILKLTNKLSEKHEVYLIPENGFGCDWMKIESRIANLTYLYKNKWDAVIFSLESQFKLPLKVKTKATIHYILHYGVLYKDTESCLASYKMPYYKITNSSWTAKHLKKHIGYTPPVVYGGIDKETFHPVKTKNVYDVLTYGDQRREWKGRGDVEMLEIERPDWKIGYMQDIDPPQEKIAKAYCSSKIFFSASWFEGWNWMGIEAMACGVPLIITKDGGSEDYAKHGYNCFQVNPQDYKEAIPYIEILMKDKIIRDKFIDNGIKTASKFTWEKSVDDFELQIKKAIYGKGNAKSDY